MITHTHACANTYSKSRDKDTDDCVCIPTSRESDLLHPSARQLLLQHTEFPTTNPKFPLGIPAQCGRNLQCSGFTGREAV